MTLTQWFLVFLVLQLVHFAGTWRLYIAAGRKKWEALVPIYSAVVLMKINQRSPWWVILLFIPVVQWIMLGVLWVDTLTSFNKRSTTDKVLGVVTLGLYLFVVNYAPQVEYTPRSAQENQKESTLSNILFAVVVATLVHTYVIQPFQIPSSSLEKTLLVGDYLFVSKLHYGPRVPSTTLSFPMVHDTIPVINKRSYLKFPQYPSFRIPGFSSIDRNDIVVFNWPADTVQRFFMRNSPFVDKPVDKKSNYVKRCVGIAGDTLSLRAGVVHINGVPEQLDSRALLQYSYAIEFSTLPQVNWEALFMELNITDGGGFSQDGKTLYINAATQQVVEQFKKLPGFVKATRFVADGPGGVFGKKEWNVDNMGPIYLPKAGETVALTMQNIPLYEYAIKHYEKQSTAWVDGEFTINGQKATNYTFQYNYYWMMGDNRHRSEDSRYWGMVPENHVVGKPVFVWFSKDPLTGKIRWDRVFTTVKGDGPRTSYIPHFLVLVGLYVIGSYFYKRRKKETA